MTHWLKEYELICLLVINTDIHYINMYTYMHTYCMVGNFHGV